MVIYCKPACLPVYLLASLPMSPLVIQPTQALAYKIAFSACTHAFTSIRVPVHVPVMLSKFYSKINSGVNGKLLHDCFSSPQYAKYKTEIELHVPSRISSCGDGNEG